MRQEVHEIFEQSWKVFEEHQSGAGHQQPGAPAPGDGAKAVPGSTGAAVEAVEKQKEQASKTKGKGAVTGPTEAVAKKGKGNGKKPKTPDSKKNPFEVALQDALATRKTYMTVTSKAALVTEQINTNEAWEWARGHFQEQIIQIGEPIKLLATKGFARLFLMQELKDVKTNIARTTCSPTQCSSARTSTASSRRPRSC